MNAGQCSRKTCLQNKAFFLTFSCYFFSDRNNLIEKRYKLAEIHLQLSPPFQRILFVIILAVNYSRHSKNILISVLTLGHSPLKTVRFFLFHKVVVMDEISAIFFNLGFPPNLYRIDLRQVLASKIGYKDPTGTCS